MLRSFFVSILCVLSFVKVGSADFLLNNANEEIINKDLNILTLNTWGLPIWYPNSNKKDRYHDIYESLKVGDYNVICLQEVFDRKLRNELKPLLNSYHSMSEFSCKRNIGFMFSMDCQGGLMTLSKFEIAHEAFYHYPIVDGMKVEEVIGEKGFLVTEIKAPLGLIRVINTHLYSGQKDKDEVIRMSQIKHMKFILDQNYDDGIPTFLSGDLNIVHPDVAKNDSEFKPSKVYDFIRDEMEFNDLEETIGDDDFTYNNELNMYAYEKSRRQKLDYIMASKEVEIKKIIPIKSQVVFDGMNSLSDHSGYNARFSSLFEMKELVLQK